MKWMQTALVVFSLVFGVNGAMAGSGHHHGPVTEPQVGKIAENIVQDMARRGNLSTSWANRSATGLEKTSLDGNVVWKAVFSNDKEPSPEKRNLNVYINLTGGLIKTDHAKK
ncbi:MAG: hypothetical protein HW380_2919 [Magnetococcales bacterium]|nr:hypothetical protein [Magnetococcales bacterium]HIJ84286.1 hypothetical protein [Magnetococcales bacterium]